MRRGAVLLIGAALGLVVTACGGATAPPAGTSSPAAETPSPAAETSPPSVSDTALGVPGIVVYTQERDLLFSDGKSVRTLVPGQETVDLLSPALASDGSVTAYVSFLVVPPSPEQPFGSDLHIITPDGTDQVVLSHQADGEFYWTPRWTTDGRQLVYAHQRNEADTEGRTFKVQVETIDLASGAVMVIRDNARDPDLSPDGSLLVFVDDPALTHRLSVMRTDGIDDQSIVDLDDNLAVFRLPQFSPDGEWIAFLASGNGPLVSAAPTAAATSETARLNGVSDLWLIRPDGTGLHRLTTLQEDQPDFAWSSDGREILLRGSFGLYLIDIGERTVQLIGPGEFHGWFDWMSNPPTPGGQVSP